MDKFFRYLIPIALTLIFHLGSYAFEPKLTADQLEYSDDQKKLSALGNANLCIPKTQLNANNIYIYSESFLAIAEGNVNLSRKNFFTLCESLTYNFQNKNIQAQCFKLGYGPFRFAGQWLHGNIDHCLSTGKSIIYFGEPDPFTLNVCTRAIDFFGSNFFSQPEYIRVRGAKLRIGKFPIFYIPRFSHSLQEYPIDFKTHFGFRNNLGAFTSNHLYLTANPHLKWGGDFDYYTKRGFLYGPYVNYWHCTPDTHIKYGELISGYINDYGSVEHDVIGRKLPKERYFVEWKHQQEVLKKVTFTNQIRHWKDSEVVRDFRPGLFNGDQEPDSFLEAMYTGDLYYFSVFSRYNPNDFHSVQERLPEINFNLRPTKLGNTPIYNRAHVSLVHLRQKDPFGIKRELSSDRLDSYYELRMPLHLHPALSITPLAGGRITHYFFTSPSHSDEIDFSYLKGQLGVDAQINIFGQWNYCNKLWKINGLRHIFRPIAQYRYIPVQKLGKGSTPPIERDIFSTNLKPIDLGYFRNRDDHREHHLVRVGLENNWQTRNPCGYGSIELAYLNLYQDIRFEKRAEENRFSDLFAELGFYPIHWFNFSLFGRYDVESSSLQELRTQLKLIDGHKWSLHLSSNNLQNRTDQYMLHAYYRFNSQYEASACLRFNARTCQFTEQTYSLYQQLGNSWEITYRFSFRKGSKKENDIKFTVLVDLIALSKK